jgi:homoserine dehydrogenase
MVPERHPLASVRDSFNAVFIEGDAVGELMLYGRGAGGAPTASAVLGDLVDAAKNLVEGRKGATVGALAPRPIRAIDEVWSQFYLLVEVADRPGVLAAIATEFGRHGVSIRSMNQREKSSGPQAGDEARLIFVTHKAREADVRATVDALQGVEAVHRVGSVLRVLGEEE